MSKRHLKDSNRFRLSMVKYSSGSRKLMLLAKIIRLTPISMMDSYIFGFLLSKINVNLFWTSGPITVQIRLKKVHKCCLYIDSSSAPVRDPWLRMVKSEKILKLRLKNWTSNTWLKSNQSTQSTQILGTCSWWPQRSFEGHLKVADLQMIFKWP